jgi:hypothetical protein
MPVYPDVRLDMLFQACPLVQRTIRCPHPARRVGMPILDALGTLSLPNQPLSGNPDRRHYPAEIPDVCHGQCISPLQLGVPKPEIIFTDDLWGYRRW